MGIQDVQAGCNTDKPFALTYRLDIVLPMDIAVPSLRVSIQNSLTPDEYIQAMAIELEDLDEV